MGKYDKVELRIGTKYDGFILTPGRYVGATAEDEDDESFGEKMAELTGLLYEQMAKAEELDAVIRKNLEGLGYGG
ncbi:hypothetical protein [Thiolapillus sp.]|uniref:hypothetical protein n=1 Tax=Thiolapillus sp. TaxID=2017437 RepID=UPI003AF5AB03